jgi:membrane-bound lytic murein transglycosylase A
MRQLCLLATLALAGCVQPIAMAPAPPPPPYVPPFPSYLVQTLPGWANDDTAAALSAFVRGCKAIELMPPDQSLGGAGIPATIAGAAGLWQKPCDAAKAITPRNTAAARQFFETNFVAYQIPGQARIAGYFEPEYQGAKNLSPHFTVPLYAKPAEPVLAHLPRSAIDNNALNRQAPVTAYLSSPVDAFMLQIQGSGRILLRNGTTLRVGFDGQNGQPYTPIGSILVKHGYLARDEVSFATVAAWLKTHPRQARSIMEENARYVFLKPLGALPQDQGAPGTLGVPKTAGRTLAVENDIIPFGVPAFLAGDGSELNRLTIAQDTDGGIRGAAEAKLFLGGGASAEAAMSAMPQYGTIYLLLPRPEPST